MVKGPTMQCEACEYWMTVSSAEHRGNCKNCGEVIVFEETEMASFKKRNRKKKAKVYVGEQKKKTSVLLGEYLTVSYGTKFQSSKF
jgi:hypothetical protein